MIPYRAITITNLVGGNVELNKDQLRRRRHLVTANADGTFAVKNKIQFKAGEEFGYDGQVPKGLAENMTELVEETAVEYPIHIGDGNFELSDGTVMRGKKSAAKAEAKLADEAEDEPVD